MPGMEHDTTKETGHWGMRQRERGDEQIDIGKGNGGRDQIKHVQDKTATLEMEEGQ